MHSEIKSDQSIRLKIRRQPDRLFKEKFVAIPEYDALPMEIVHRLYQKKKPLSTDDDDGEILTETQKLLPNVLSHEGCQAEIELASNELHAEIYPKIAWSTPLTPDDTVVLPGLKFLIFMFLYRVRSLVYYQVPIFVPNTNKTLFFFLITSSDFFACFPGLFLLSISSLQR